MPPIPHAKPENVLKRAQELIAVEQSQAALTLLHEHITSKKSRNTPIASLEPVILLFVELCVELRKGKTAKDGLYQYKNIAQNTTVQTIEMVLRNFIERAEAKVTNAQQIAEQITLDQVDDLENLETPESLLLATVSGEQSKDRTDRKVVTPWLKFLWETYRTVLDILRNNARLENMYQQTATQAFGFCLKYTRKTEFRRLCELLRNHLVNASKYSAQMHAINLNDPDTQQRHLDIRFQQLNAAVDLELWQEAFRSVEDIHNILTVSKRPPKAIMMANYYEKLTRIFRTSDNHLFHAASWNRYFNLLRTSAAALAAGTATKKESPVTNDAEFSRVASFVILSALSIPVISTARSRSTTETEEANKRTRSSRLTNLLGMSNAPTRTGLFKDILAKGLLKRARPEIRELYTILEVEFHPLSICKKIAPILTKIAEDEDMNRYIAPLQQVILTRLFQQLSQVYDTVQLDFVINLVSFPEPFEIDAGTIEKFIMNACKKGDLAIRVDHAAGALTFESDIFSSPKSLQIGSSIATSDKDMGVQRLQSTPQEIVRTSLSRLAKTLYLTCTYVDPSFTDQRIRDKAEAFARAEAGAKKEHEETLARREIIEQRKEAAENAAASKEKEESRLRAIRQQQLAAAESQRLAEENKKRERERQDKDLQRIREQELRKQIEELQLTGIKLDVDISTLDSTAIRKMKLDQLEKEKKDTNEKLRITSKRIDHLERAYRKEELTLLPQDYERQRKEDLEAHTETINQLLTASKQKHEEDVALKKRLSRLVPQYESFRDDIRSRRHEEFEARQKKAEQQLQIEMDKRRKAVREERERQRREEEEAERARIEEEERLAREEEERIAKEEEDAKKKEAARAEQEVRRKEREEAAAKQREREAQAEAKMEERRRQRLQEGGRPAPAPATAPAAAPAESAGSSAFRPTKVPAAAGSGGGWRERLAAKKAAEEAAAAEGGSPADANGEAAQPAPEPVQEPEPEAVEEGGPRRYRPGAFRQKAPTEAVMSTEDATPRERPPREQREPREPREQREPREPRENRESRQPTETQEGEAAAPRERPEGRAGTWGRTNRTEGEGGAEGGSKYRPPRREGTAGGAGESSEGGAPRYQARRTEGGDGKYVPRQRQTGEDGQPRESREPRDPNAPPGERRYEGGRGFGRGRGGGNMGERTGSGRGEGRTGSGRGGERSDSRRGGGADKPADRAGGSSWR